MEIDSTSFPFMVIYYKDGLLIFMRLIKKDYFFLNTISINFLLEIEINLQLIQPNTPSILVTIFCTKKIAKNAITKILDFFSCL
jgi:hypothetical protein